MRIEPVVLTAIVALAGCLAETPPPPGEASPAMPGQRLDAPLEGLPCKSELREGAPLTQNLREIGFAPLPEGRALGNELTIARQGATTLVVLTRPSAGAGFDLFDGSDPSAPRLLSSWRPEASDFVQDAKFVDASTVLIGGSSTLQLVDVGNATDPETFYVHRLEGPGAHMVGVFVVSNRTFAAAAKGENRDVSIFEIVGSDRARSLVRVSRPALTPLGETNRPDPVRSHDVWFEVDPILKKPLLWVANVYWGLVALDVSDPARPVTVANIRNLDANQNYVHNVQVTHLDGRRLVVATAEYGLPALKVWDATDLANPRLMATWSVGTQTKGMPIVGNHVYPTKGMHNFQVVGSHIVLAHLDMGLFTFDLAGLSPSGALTRLEPTGRALPTGDPGPNPRASMYTGDYFGSRDVVVFDGVVWVSETTKGLRALQFGCFELGTGISSTG